MNQGMLMESMNLASAWNLPVLFVCKDDGWAITTQSEKVTGGDLDERARGLGIPDAKVNGCDVSEVWEAAHSAIERARSGQGPTFLHARCVHFEGHFLGFPLIRMVRDPRRDSANDPVQRARTTLQSEPARLQGPEDQIEKSNALASALVEVPS